MKHFTTVHDVNDPKALVQLARMLKEQPDKFANAGKGKTLGLIFLNPSLRTRLSTQKAARLLGMEVMVMNLDREGWAIEWNDDVIMNGSKTEHIRDAAAVLGSYCDIIGMRSFPSLTDKRLDQSEKYFVQLMRYCKVPVLSQESATLHPLQSLADSLTIYEHRRPERTPKVVLTWAPHIKPLPQAVANSFSEWMLRSEVDFVITQPEGYELCEDYTRGAKIEYSQEKALDGADFVYVKNWSSFEQYGTMPEVKSNWMLDPDKYRLTNKAGIMHCLPVRRDLELSSSMIDHPNSLIQHQAANRVCTAQAVLLSLLNGKVPVSIDTEQYILAET